jgi:hypothetical protein
MMKRGAGFFRSALLLLLLSLPAGQLPAAADALWLQAVENVGKSSSFVPFEYEVEHRMFNGRGDLLTHGLTVTRIVKDEEGLPGFEVLRSEMYKGKPMDGSPFGGGQNDEASGGMEAVMYSPLDPAWQEYVTAQRIGVEMLDDGAAAVYRFTFDPGGDSRAEGTIWIDPELGMPLRIEREVTPPMRLIKSFSVREEYGNSSSLSVLSSSSYTVIVSFIITREIVFQMRFKDYRIDPEVAALIQEGGFSGTP